MKKNSDELKNLKKEYADFMVRLEQAVTDGKIFTHDKRTILEMSKKVLENIAFKYSNVQKEVKEVMGGKILDYEGRSIFYEGVEQGRNEGIAVGRSETLNAAIEFMRSSGMSNEKINNFRNSMLKN